MNYFEQSDKITEGLRKSFHRADAKMANRVCYGYITLPNGELTINKTEGRLSNGFSIDILRVTALAKLPQD